MVDEMERVARIGRSYRFLCKARHALVLILRTCVKLRIEHSIRAARAPERNKKLSERLEVTANEASQTSNQTRISVAYISRDAVLLVIPLFIPLPIRLKNNELTLQFFTMEEVRPAWAAQRYCGAGRCSKVGLINAPSHGEHTILGYHPLLPLPLPSPLNSLI